MAEILCVTHQQSLAKNGLEADFFVALEPTNLAVVHAAKGILRVWIDVPGHAAHGATPERGVNAIYRSLPLLQALRDELSPYLASRRHEVLGRGNLNLGIMRGGQELNIVPATCRLGLDLRLHPGFPAARALPLLGRLLARHAAGPPQRAGICHTTRDRLGEDAAPGGPRLGHGRLVLRRQYIRRRGHSLGGVWPRVNRAGPHERQIHPRARADRGNDGVPALPHGAKTCGDPAGDGIAGAAPGSFFPWERQTGATKGRSADSRLAQLRQRF